MPLSTNNETQYDDLTSCDREPVSLIASIQDRGLLLAFTPEDHLITNASANAAKILGHETARGRSLLDALGPLAGNTVLAQLQTPEWRTHRRQHFQVSEVNGRRHLDAFMFQVDGVCVVEIEIPTQPPPPEMNETARQALLSTAIESIRDANDFAAAGRSLCWGIRQITGMDRIMVYRFNQPSWSGEVIAEDKVAGAHSFMDHHFPASDIPKPARDLYLRNRLRFIHDSALPASPVVPPTHPRSRKPLDLSDSRLRGVSTIHLEYLRNMGVGSSFSLAIIVNDRLWGLVACHAQVPMHLPAHLRASCEILTGTYAVRVRSETDAVPAQMQAALDARLQDVLLQLSQSSAPQADLLRHHRLLEEAFQGSGVALVIGSHVDLAGLTPIKADTLELAKILLQRLDDSRADSLTLQNLTELNPRWEMYRRDAAGVLALKLPHVEDGIFLIFRPETIRTIKWGGDPRKQLERRDYQGRINPRLSFESWSETTRNRCQAWESFEVQSARQFRDLLFVGLVRRDQVIKELEQSRRRDR